MIQWSDEKPQTRQGRKGFSYYIWDENCNLKKQYCNRIFKSIDDAQDSYDNLINKNVIAQEYSAAIYDVETHKVSRWCYSRNLQTTE